MTLCANRLLSTPRPPLRQAALAVALSALVAGAQAESLDDLLDDTPKAAAASPIKGFMQVDAAHALTAPRDWTRLRTRGEIGSQGKWRSGIKWKASLRLDYDGVFDHVDRYPPAVRDDQQSQVRLHETYLDIPAGDWDLRLGRQHVVWGEMVGLFFADVVSARDMREFILPDFDALRTPQWATRAEYFKDDFHAELLWVPLPGVDDFGKPGAEFYPYQPLAPGYQPVYRDADKPARKLRNGNYGARLNWLLGGWDVAGFGYRSFDVQPAFTRQIVGTGAFYQPHHPRITQWGGTLAKDIAGVVLKAEGVYTRGRAYAVADPRDADGLALQETMDWAVGLDFSLPADTNLNAQLFQRLFFDHDARIVPDARENGYSLYLHKTFGRWEAQATFISSFNRTDWLFRPRVQWNVAQNWRLLAGVDIFKGPPLGLFGQYDARDRAYTEVRYSF